MIDRESKPLDKDGDLEPMLPLAGQALRTALRDPGDLFKQLRQVSELLGDLAVAPCKPALVFQVGGKTQSKEIGDGLTVGRSSECDLAFPNCGEMSRRQFKITTQGARYVLADSGSLNGTFVRGVRDRIEMRELRDGDLIQSGGMTFAFVHPAGGTVV